MSLSSTSLSVLIIEDDSSFLKLLKIRLSSWNPEIEFTVATSIGQAKNILDMAEHAFDLVIADQHLPDGMSTEILSHSRLQESALLAMSSDDAPEIPGNAIVAGAQHFLGKRQVSDKLFIPLIEGLLEKKKLEKDLFRARLKAHQMDTIKTLLATLRHEINNPLGAVLGGAYLLKTDDNIQSSQADTLRLIEASGNRIKKVLNQLCEAANLETVTKGEEQMFQIPGDENWDKEE